MIYLEGKHGAGLLNGHFRAFRENLIFLLKIRGCVVLQAEKKFEVPSPKMCKIKKKVQHVVHVGPQHVLQMHFFISAAPPEQWIIAAVADVVTEPRGVIHDQTFISEAVLLFPFTPDRS